MSQGPILAPCCVPQAKQATLRGLYHIALLAVWAGVAVVFLLNLATPMDFTLEMLRRAATNPLGVTAREVGGHLLALALISILPPWFIKGMMSPVARCLDLMCRGESARPALLDQARRRLLNLPFVFAPVNMLLWLVVPAVLATLRHLMGNFDLHTAVTLAVRAFMVGMVSSSIAFFRLEAYIRRNLIPVFFPDGRLAMQKGVVRMSIRRRIRLLWAAGTLNPGLLLLITLTTLQWEVVGADITPYEYGKGILIFSLVLTGTAFVSALFLNWLVCRSILMPLREMLGVVEQVRAGNYGVRVPVITNDELGILGDTGNAMIRGLAERARLRDEFGRYVTPEIRDEILAGRIPLAGERREATVLFADLRGFTPLVENNPPEEVMNDLREYFTAMHQAIRENGGLVLQFVGDEIEAVFGVPLATETHPDQAVAAALGMRRALARLNSSRQARGKAPLSHGLGIHSGPVLAGNSGSQEQSAYSLIGNTVNVASRLQELTKEFATDIIVSDETRHRLTTVHPFVRLGEQTVRGISRPVVLWRLPE